MQALARSAAMVLCAVLFSLPAHAAIRRVKSDAAGTVADGASWETAYASVQAALDASAAGDEVWVCRGAYPGLLTVRAGLGLYGGFAGTETTRAERNPALNQTTLDGQNTGRVITVTDASDGFVLDGFTVQSGTSLPTDENLGGGLAARNIRITIENNFFLANYGQGRFDPVLVKGGASAIYIAGGEAVIRRNHFSYNVHGSQSWGMIFCDGARATIEYNRFDRNNCIIVESRGGDLRVHDNVFFYDRPHYGDPILSLRGPIRLTNNTITVCWRPTDEDEPMRAISIYPDADVLMENNIIAWCQAGIRIETDPSDPSKVPTLVARNNCIFGNELFEWSGWPDPTGTDGNIAADPQIIDRVYGDCHVQPTSPCIDAGYDAAVQSGDTDLDGRARLMSAHVDIGAYESLRPRIYSLDDAARALRVGAGFAEIAPDDAHLDLEPGPLDLCDAILIARKVTGLSPNPK